MLLLDAGPIVALLDRSDRHHRACVAQLAAVREGLATTWPVIAEALERLADVRGGAGAVWDLLERSQCRLLALDSEDYPRLRELTGGRGRMTLASASLVRVAERDGVESIFTLDRRLSVRKAGRRRLFRRVLGPLRGDPRALEGSLKLPGRKAVSLDEMEQAIRSRAGRL